jgi:hypothetical protein
MKTILKIDTETSKIEIGYHDDREDVFVPVHDAKRSDALEAVFQTLQLLQCAVVEDLKDVWKRLDKIEDRCRAHRGDDD